ncbi:MAG: hypothetical protein RR735_07995 [Bacteroidales bacterium]
MKKALLFIITLLASIILSYAQNDICGKVLDIQTGELLYGVYVTAYNNNAIVSYSISKEDGTFCIKSKDQEITHLLFYLMGYKQQKIVIESPVPKNLFITSHMRQAVIELKSIVVKPKAIRIKGDTVIYNADNFRRKEDRNIGEIIARLPGVKVSSSGQIKVQGETINKFYIEDMDLLGGRYGIAVRNLRPIDIAYIQVYNNHQPIKALSEIEGTNRAAINIKLTQKAKRRWLLSFGAEAGLDFPDVLYSAKVGAMRFAGKSQTFIIAKSDNSGSNIIREAMIQNMGPGHFSMDKLDNNINDLFNVSLRRLPIPEEYYYFNKSNIVSINQLNKITLETELKSNILFTTNIVRNNYSQKQIITTQDKSEIIIADSNNVKRRDIRLDGEITITSNKEKLYLQDVFSFKILKDKAHSYVTNNNTVYNQGYNLPKFLIENKFSFIKGNRNRIYKFYNNTRFSHLNQELNIESGIMNPIFNSKTAIQSIFLKEFNNNAYFSFVRRISKVSFSFEPGADIAYNELNSRLVPQAKTNDFEINTTNNLALFSIKPYINTLLSYSGKRIRTTLSIPLMLRLDALNNFWDTYFIYAPKFRLNYTISPTLSISADATISNEVGEIQSMTNGYIYSSYRNFNANGTVPNNINQYYGITFNYTNIVNLFTARFMATYSRNKYNTTESSLYLNDYTFTNFINRNTNNNDFNILAEAQKSFGINIFTIGVNLQYGITKASQYLQNSLYWYDSKNYGITFNMRFSPTESFSMNYILNFTRNTFSASVKNHTDYISNKLVVIYFPISKLELKGTFYHILQKREKYIDISLPFLDFNTAYKIGKKLSINCSIKNIMNTKEYKSMYYSGISSYESTIDLRGFELTTGITLDF